MKREKSMQTFFDEYAESHQNPLNKAIHWVCVPLIVFSLIGLFMSIPFPFYEKSYFANWSFVVYIASMLFYWRYSQNIFLGLAIVFALFIWINWQIYLQGWPLLPVCASIFILSWIGQFYGHKVEGKKPSFLKDLQFLLVGPAWLLHFIYRKRGISY